MRAARAARRTDDNDAATAAAAAAIAPKTDGAAFGKSHARSTKVHTQFSPKRRRSNTPISRSRAISAVVRAKRISFSRGSATKRPREILKRAHAGQSVPGGDATSRFPMPYPGMGRGGGRQVRATVTTAVKVCGPDKEAVVPGKQEDPQKESGDDAATMGKNIRQSRKRPQSATVVRTDSKHLSRASPRANRPSAPTVVVAVEHKNEKKGHRRSAAPETAGGRAEIWEHRGTRGSCSSGRLKKPNTRPVSAPVRRRDPDAGALVALSRMADGSYNSPGELRIMKWVVLRETYLDKLHGVVAGSRKRARQASKNASTRICGGKEQAQLFRLLVELLTVLRRITVEIVEAIEKWRGVSGKTVFLWGSSNYLVKAAGDVAFLARLPGLEAHLGVSIADNPFLCHVRLNGRPALLSCSPTVGVTMSGEGGVVASGSGKFARTASESLGVSAERVEAAAAVLYRELQRTGHMPSSGGRSSTRRSSSRFDADSFNLGPCVQYGGGVIASRRQTSLSPMCQSNMRMATSRYDTNESGAHWQQGGGIDAPEGRRSSRMSLSNMRRASSRFDVLDENKADAYREPGDDTKYYYADESPEQGYDGTKISEQIDETPVRREPASTVLHWEAQRPGRTSRMSHSNMGEVTTPLNVDSDTETHRENNSDAGVNEWGGQAQAIDAGCAPQEPSAEQQLPEQEWNGIMVPEATMDGLNIQTEQIDIVERPSPFMAIHSMCDGLLTKLQVGLGAPIAEGAAGEVISSQDAGSVPQNHNGGAQDGSALWEAKHANKHVEWGPSADDNNNGEQWDVQTAGRKGEWEPEVDSNKGVQINLKSMHGHVEWRQPQTAGNYAHTQWRQQSRLNGSRDSKERLREIQNVHRLIEWGPETSKNLAGEKWLTHRTGGDEDDPEVSDGEYVERMKRETPQEMLARNFTAWAGRTEARLNYREAKAARYYHRRQLKRAMSIWETYRAAVLGGRLAEAFAGQFGLSGRWYLRLCFSALKAQARGALVVARHRSTVSVISVRLLGVRKALLLQAWHRWSSAITSPTAPMGSGGGGGNDVVPDDLARKLNNTQHDLQAESSVLQWLEDKGSSKSFPCPGSDVEQKKLTATIVGKVKVETAIVNIGDREDGADARDSSSPKSKLQGLGAKLKSVASFRDIGSKTQTRHMPATSSLLSMTGEQKQLLKPIASARSLAALTAHIMGGQAGDAPAVATATALASLSMVEKKRLAAGDTSSQLSAAIFEADRARAAHLSAVIAVQRAWRAAWERQVATRASQSVSSIQCMWRLQAKRKRAGTRLVRAWRRRAGVQAHMLGQALFEAAGAGDLRAVAFLLREKTTIGYTRKADANTTGPDGATALHEACRESRRSKSANPRIIGLGNALSSCRRRGLPDRVGVIKALVEAGAAVESQDSEGNTPMMAAAADGGGETVTALAAAGAEIDAAGATRRGRTPLVIAAQKANASAAAALLMHGARVNLSAEDGSTPLHEAAGAGSSAVAEMLVRAGAQVDARNKSVGMTPLHFAIANDQHAAARLLVHSGADVSLADSRGLTPLRLAVEMGDTLTVKLVLAADRPAELDSEDKNGGTALHAACRRGLTDIAQLLLEAGADPLSRDTDGRTPELVALDLGHSDCAGLFYHMAVPTTTSRVVAGTMNIGTTASGSCDRDKQRGSTGDSCGDNHTERSSYLGDAQRWNGASLPEGDGYKGEESSPGRGTEDIIKDAYPQREAYGGLGEERAWTNAKQLDDTQLSEIGRPHTSAGGLPVDDAVQKELCEQSGHASHKVPAGENTREGAVQDQQEGAGTGKQDDEDWTRETNGDWHSVHGSFSEAATSNVAEERRSFAAPPPTQELTALALDSELTETDYKLLSLEVEADGDGGGSGGVVTDLKETQQQERSIGPVIDVQEHQDGEGGGANNEGWPWMAGVQQSSSKLAGHGATDQARREKVSKWRIGGDDNQRQYMSPSQSDSNDGDEGNHRLAEDQRVAEYDTQQEDGQECWLADRTTEWNDTLTRWGSYTAGAAQGEYADTYAWGTSSVVPQHQEVENSYSNHVSEEEPSALETKNSASAWEERRFDKRNASIRSVTENDYGGAGESSDNTAAGVRDVTIDSTTIAGQDIVAGKSTARGLNEIAAVIQTQSKWMALVDQYSGSVYYMDQQSGVTQWEKPQDEEGAIEVANGCVEPMIAT